MRKNSPLLYSSKPKKQTQKRLKPEFVAPREIISILNLGTPLNSTKGKLDKPSIKVITENIQERLATPTKYREGKHKISSIIELQALELAHTIQGIKAKFKPYVARY